MNQEERIERIQSFAELKEDWDSYGGAPVNPKAIAIALAISHVLNGEWFPSPTPNGGVCFEDESAEIHIYAAPKEARP